MTEKMDLPTTTSPGKGLDVGTANLMATWQDGEGRLITRLQRNSFIEVKPDPFTQSMLKRQKVPYVAHNGSLYVLGADAYGLANIMGREVRRPMSEGLISPNELDALLVVKLLLESLLGKPRQKDEPVCFSIPAPPAESSQSVIYHQGVLAGILRQLGYKPFPINEGLAVIYAELAERDLSGIGLSFGAGMVNACVAYRSVPAFAFSLTRSGDWIDTSVANVLGMKPPRVTLMKERGLSLLAPKTREEQAFGIYYRHLITAVVENLKHYHDGQSHAIPDFPEPIDIVCAGGTTLIGGFLEVFKEEVARVGLPIKIREVRCAPDALSSTARGCLLAAMSGYEV